MPLTDGKSRFHAQVLKTENGEYVGSASTTFDTYPEAFSWANRIKNEITEPEWSHDKEGLIYLIIDESGRTKIGKSDESNLKHRMSKHQCGNAEELKIAAIWKCVNPHGKELEIHRTFMDKRIRGEWFDVSVEELVFEFPDFEPYIEEDYEM